MSDNNVEVEESEQAWPNEVPRMTKEEKSAFVKRLVRNEVFVSSQVKDYNDMSMVFLPLAMGAFTEAPESYLDTVGLLWEEYSKQTPRGVNGYPSFLSMHVLHKEDWKVIHPAYIKMMEALESLDVGDLDDEPQTD